MEYGSFVSGVEKLCIVGLFCLASAFAYQCGHQNGFADGEQNIRRIMKEDEECMKNFRQKYPLSQPARDSNSRLETMPSTTTAPDFYTAEKREQGGRR